MEYEDKNKAARQWGLLGKAVRSRDGERIPSENESFENDFRDEHHLEESVPHDEKVKIQAACEHMRISGEIYVQLTAHPVLTHVAVTLLDSRSMQDHEINIDNPSFRTELLHYMQQYGLSSSTCRREGIPIKSRCNELSPITLWLMLTMRAVKSFKTYSILEIT